MKSKLLLLIILIGISATSFSQKYSKTYEQIINYNSRGNGKNATVRFKVNYDVFFGEPTRMHIAKVQSYGNVINYKGRTFTREEVGSEVFDNIKIQ